MSTSDDGLTAAAAAYARNPAQFYTYAGGEAAYAAVAATRVVDPRVIWHEALAFLDRLIAVTGKKT
jgi:hypothetical protein